MSGLSIAKYFRFERVKVIDQQVNQQTTFATIGIAPDERYKPRCHICGADAVTLHSKGHVRFVRDLNMASSEVWLSVNYRKIKCDFCLGVRVEELSFCNACKRLTNRLARYVYELCRLMPVDDVARHLNLNRKTVKEIDCLALEEHFGGTDYTNLQILALDEIAVKKGHLYLTVVLDYLTGRVVWVGAGRNKETLDAFFAGMSKEQKDAIEAVAMDMWEPYINRVQHHCPCAKIVFDFFHLVQAFSRVIDNIRRTEYACASIAEKPVLRGSRFLLLKNKENLTETQHAKLQDLLNLNTTLNAVYILKDQLKVIYQQTTRAAAQAALNLWCVIAGQIKHPAIKRFIGRLRFFEYGILNHSDYPISTSRLEGVNNKIKVIKRRAYGFHDPHYFALKIKQAFSGQLSGNFLG
jgi:transposase